MTGSDYCFMHDPARAADRARARKKGGVNRRRSGAAADGGPVELRSADDVLTVLERAMNDVLCMENSATRARTIGYLCGAALKALEVGEVEDRLEALEKVAGFTVVQFGEDDNGGGAKAWEPKGVL